MGRGVCSKQLCNMAMMAATLMHGMIYGEKPYTKFLLRNQWTDFFEILNVALGTPGTS